ncbi:hypothetical protein F751_1821 [Auxenochlorella protothecoides]|uniref:Uncharacterized protein n=1 Tax=Auxenochlorella protothecoides TaxID=3075 RepID=A0A087SGT8_AUXPR|nr:hypothetical protein F751_1821 [Auxenochlorella protothecoides]KFM24942.1 hypothetical protein F751_1821 [Auxenochlorella protothecoides]
MRRRSRCSGAEKTPLHHGAHCKNGLMSDGDVTAGLLQYPPFVEHESHLPKQVALCLALICHPSGISMLLTTCQAVTCCPLALARQRINSHVGISSSIFSNILNPLRVARYLHYCVPRV